VKVHSSVRCHLTMHNFTTSLVSPRGKFPGTNYKIGRVGLTAGSGNFGKDNDLFSLPDNPNPYSTVQPLD
jgi:hypothetical protein